MRIDLNRIRNVDRMLVLTIAVLVAAAGISAWLYQDVAKREKTVDALAAEVTQYESQANSIPQSTTPALTAEEVAERLSRLGLPKGSEEGFREKLAALATAHHLDVHSIMYSQTPVDTANATGENPLLVALGIP